MSQPQQRRGLQRLRERLSGYIELPVDQVRHCLCRAFPLSAWLRRCLSLRSPAAGDGMGRGGRLHRQHRHPDHAAAPKPLEPRQGIGRHGDTGEQVRRPSPHGFGARRQRRSAISAGSLSPLPLCGFYFETEGLQHVRVAARDTGDSTRAGRRGSMRRPRWSRPRCRCLFRVFTAFRGPAFR